MTQGFLQKITFITSPLLPVLWVPLIYGVISSFGIILAVWEVAEQLLDEQTKVPVNEVPYDFIVVGAGSAGAVVANRLSKHYNVLLLEAGGTPNPIQFIPAFGTFLVNYPEVDWMHRTVPQKYGSLNSVNQQSSWSAGRGLGGTGNLNLMIHLRGNKLDYDNWEKLTGDPSWNWEGVLPFFKSYEDYGDPGEERLHGYGGDLHIEAPAFIGMGPEFVKAGGELGYPHVDLNGDYSEGFDILRHPTKKGVRQAPYLAFIKPAKTRKTLTIRKFSYVTRVLFRGDNEAYGVEYDRHGQTRVARATKEVILSAGSITTPRILMISGIGPAQHLNELNIPVLQDLPVGERLQDHIAGFLGPFFINDPSKNVFLDRDLTPSAFIEWFKGGTGILSTPGSTAAGSISSSYAKGRGEGNWPDIVIYYFGFSAHKTLGATLSHAFSLKLDELTKYFEHAVGKNSFILVLSGARPRSTGYIKLGGRSPYDSLIIEPNYMSDAGDVDIGVMVEAAEIALQLTENTTALGGNLGCRLTDEKLPGCEHLMARSRAYLECVVRRFSITLHHPIGTCGMGRVVDTKLRVLGTKRLRVIDSSIQPEIITTNTQASALMIGEKGAHMVLEYWNSRVSPSPAEKYARFIKSNPFLALLNLTRTSSADFNAIRV